MKSKRIDWRVCCALAVTVLGFSFTNDARAQAPEKLTILIFSPPSLGALLPPVIKAQKLDEKTGSTSPFRSGRLTPTSRKSTPASSRSAAARR